MDRIFYQSGATDAYTGKPIFIFDTSFLPKTDLINYDEFIPTLMKLLPQKPYVLVMFSCGLNKISWIWGVKFLKLFLSEDDNLNHVVRIISVHDSWFVKSITQILTNYTLTKRHLLITNLLDLKPQANLVIHCLTLLDLTQYVDIRQLKISLNVFKHNLMLEPAIAFCFPIEPLITPQTRLSRDSPVLFHHFYQLFNIINTYGDRVELIFHKPGSKPSTDVLYQCVSRNQLLWINDWLIYCIATTFKRLLQDLPEPLINPSNVQLPIKDDITSTLGQFERLAAQGNGTVVFQLLDLCGRIINNGEVTRHTSASLAKSLSHCVGQVLMLLQNKDDALIVSRLLKNFMDHWLSIYHRHKHRFPSIDHVMRGDDNIDINDSYNLSHDITTTDMEAVDLTSVLGLLGGIERKEKPHARSKSLVEARERYTERRAIERQTNTTENGTKNITENRTNITEGRKGNTTEKRTDITELTDNRTPVENRDHPSTNMPDRHVGDRHGKKLADVSNITFQYPPQKYKFDRSHKKLVSSLSSDFSLVSASSQSSVESTRKPVIRGRKVGELARLYEERAQGLRLLSGL